MYHKCTRNHQRHEGRAASAPVWGPDDRRAEPYAGGRQGRRGGGLSGLSGYRPRRWRVGRRSLSRRVRTSVTEHECIATAESAGGDGRRLACHRFQAVQPQEEHCSRAVAHVDCSSKLKRCKTHCLRAVQPREGVFDMVGSRTTLLGGEKDAINPCPTRRLSPYDCNRAER